MIKYYITQIFYNKIYLPYLFLMINFLAMIVIFKVIYPIEEYFSFAIIGSCGWSIGISMAKSIESLKRKMPFPQLINITIYFIGIVVLITIIIDIANSYNWKYLSMKYGIFYFFGMFLTISLFEKYKY